MKGVKKLHIPPNFLTVCYKLPMKNRLKWTLFICIFSLFLAACGKERLTPLVNPITVNELRNDQPVNFSYKIDETQIDEYARNTGKFPLFGKLFQAIAVVLANTTINSRGGHQLDLEPVDVDLEALGEIDFNYIDWIKLDSLLLMVENGKKKDSLEFIEKIEIYALLDRPIDGLPMDAKGFSRLVYFDRKAHDLECEGRCVNLRLEKVNWKQLLQNNKKVRLQPKLIINSVPRSSMALSGSVSFSIKFKLGF